MLREVGKNRISNVTTTLSAPRLGLSIWTFVIVVVTYFDCLLVVDHNCHSPSLSILCFSILFIRFFVVLQSSTEIGVATKECFLRDTPATEVLAVSESVDNSNCWLIQDKEELFVTVFQTTSRHSASVAVVNEGSSSRFLHRPAWASVKDKGEMLVPWQPLTTSNDEEDGQEKSEEEWPVVGATRPVAATGNRTDRNDNINDVVNKSMSSFLARLLVVSDYLRAAQRQNLLRRVLALLRQIIRFPPCVMAFRAVCVGSAISDHEVTYCTRIT